jgi:hypothetical protein
VAVKSPVFSNYWNPGPVPDNPLSKIGKDFEFRLRLGKRIITMTKIKMVPTPGRRY